MAILQTGPNLELPTVQLQHTLPDSSAHVDWMVARDQSPDALLVSFRLAKPVTSLAVGEKSQAKRIADHRRAYLSYEGPISGHRGVVTRLNSGIVTHVQATEDALQLQVRWATGEQSLVLRAEIREVWLVQHVSPSGIFGNNEQCS